MTWSAVPDWAENHARIPWRGERDSDIGWSRLQNKAQTKPESNCDDWWLTSYPSHPCVHISSRDACGLGDSGSWNVYLWDLGDSRLWDLEDSGSWNLCLSWDLGNPGSWNVYLTWNLGNFGSWNVYWTWNPGNPGSWNVYLIWDLGNPGSWNVYLTRDLGNPGSWIVYLMRDLEDLGPWFFAMAHVWWWLTSYPSHPCVHISSRDACGPLKLLYWSKINRKRGFSRLRVTRWFLSNDPNKSPRGLTKFLLY